MIDAIVLAGGGKVEPLTEQEGVSNKAFILLHGKPLLGYILDSLDKAPSVKRIIVVGPERELQKLQQEGYSFTIASECGSMLENVAGGVALADPEQLCLVVTGDIPLITAGVIEQFLDYCQPFECDLYYPVLTRQSFMERFPETIRTYVRLMEGEVTGGNIGLISPAWFLENRARLEMFIAYRKKPLKLLRILTLRLIFKYLIKRLTINDLEKHLSRLLHLKACAVICALVEIGTDVDKLSDLETVKKAL